MEHPAEKDELTEAVCRIEAARSEHWQEHLRKHPLATAQSCPRCYGVHDAYAHAATILRDMIRQKRDLPPTEHEKCCRYLHCAHPTCCGYRGEPHVTPPTEGHA